MCFRNIFWCNSHNCFAAELLGTSSFFFLLQVSLMKPEDEMQITLGLLYDHPCKNVLGALVIDEMPITSGLVYDHPGNTFLGVFTLPLADGSIHDDSLATHGLVFMRGGLSSRWKQVVGYHLTENSFCASFLKAELIKIITACESLGLFQTWLVETWHCCAGSEFKSCRFGIQAIN